MKKKREKPGSSTVHALLEAKLGREKSDDRTRKKGKTPLF